MKKIFGVLLSGIFFSGYPVSAAEPERNDRYGVYEEKWTEDTPLPPVGSGEKVSYLWNATDVDGKPAGINAIFEMAESVGFDVAAFSTRGMASIVKRRSS